MDNIFDEFNKLTWEELASVRKSNVFSRGFLKAFNIYKAQRMIREFIPVVGIVAIAHIVLDIIKKVNK